MNDLYYLKYLNQILKFTAVCIACSNDRIGYTIFYFISGEIETSFWIKFCVIFFISLCISHCIPFNSSFSLRDTISLVRYS